jgi:hypothetical protein
LLIGPGALLNSHRARIAALAAQHRLPALYPLREYVTAGGLMKIPDKLLALSDEVIE